MNKTIADLSYMAGKLTGLVVFVPVVINLLGNGFILFAIYFSKHFYKPVNFMLGNLLAASMIGSLGYMVTFSLKTKLLSVPQELDWICPLVPVIATVYGSAEIFSIVYIIIERCRAVEKPWAKQSCVQAKVKIIIVWVAAFALVLPESFAWGHVESSEGSLNLVCKKTRALWGSKTLWIGYVLFHTAFVYAIPSLILLVELYKIGQSLKIRTVPCPPVVLKMVEYHDILRINARDRTCALRNVFLFMFIFAFMKLPAGIWWELYQLPTDTFPPSIHNAIWNTKFIFTCYVLLHTLMYPFVIFYMSSDIREHYKQILLRSCA